MRLLRILWVLSLVVPAVLFMRQTAAVGADNSFVYADALGAGWEDASWSGTADYAQTAVVHSGSMAITWTPSSTDGGWAALSIGRAYGQPLYDTTPYTNFRFYIEGASAPGTTKRFGVSLNGSSGPRIDITPYIQGGSISPTEWRLVDIPLSVLGMVNAQVPRINFQDITGVPQPATYFDDIQFYNNGATATPTPLPTSVTINVDAAANVHPISPLIYGIANPAGATSWQKDMGASLVRWGGDARSMHNWEINASNAGSDWNFQNVDQGNGDRTPGKASYNFVSANNSFDMQSLLTIPTIGWVAKDTTSQSTGVPSQGGPPIAPGSDAIAGYDPSANQAGCCIPSYPKKNAPFTYPPDTTDNAVYQDEWVNYLVHTFGNAQNGGVGFYTMDNEMDLWADDTHVDVHPVRVGYDEALSRFLDYAEAVKAVDPTAQITGPTGWGWLSLWYSGLDRGSDNFATHADRMAHGDIPFYQWFLQQVRQHDASVGHRTLDVLDIHYYPQSNVYSNAVDPTTAALRLRSTRSLWDPTYADESWQAQTEGGPYLQLIPRLQQWIAANYPGTKLGITEWNWGADGTMNGALALADVLGIYGREGVYLANYWTSPASGSPGYWAFRMFRNYDGTFSRFGDVSVQAQVGAADLNTVSAYASKDSSTGQLKVLVLNKLPGTQVNLTMNVANFGLSGTAQVYQYSQSNLSQIQRLPDLGVSGSSLTYALPAYSITLFVFPASGASAPTATVTATPTSTPSAIPTATQTPTSMPTSTSTPTLTATATNIPTSTATAAPTSTATSAPISTSTPDPISTATPAPTSTATPISAGQPQIEQVQSSPDPVGSAQPGMTISYALSAPCPNVAAVLLDLRTNGFVRTWSLGSQAAGTQSIQWNKTNSAGSLVSDGLYALFVACLNSSGQAVTMGYDLVNVSSVITSMTLTPLSSTLASDLALSFDLSAPGGAYTLMVILDPQRGVVKQFPLQQSNPGTVTQIWDGTDNTGKPLPNGRYLYGVVTLNPTDTADQHTALVFFDLGPPQPYSF